MTTYKNRPVAAEQIRKDTYDNAADRFADLLDAQDALSTALDALKGITDAPISVEMLSDMHSDVAAEARRMRQVMDDIRRMELPPERLGA